MKTIVEALKDLHGAFGGQGDLTEVQTTAEIIDEIAKVVDGSAFHLTVTPVAGTENLFGKTVSSLQSNIVIGKKAITGTLAYVTDYTGFSSLYTEQNGNYLAIKAVANKPGAVIRAQLIGGTKGPVTLDDDGMIVFKIANNTQIIRFDATVGNETATVKYSLSELVLQSE